MDEYAALANLLRVVARTISSMAQADAADATLVNLTAAVDEIDGAAARIEEHAGNEAVSESDRKED